MISYKKIIFGLLGLLAMGNLHAQRIDRVEPLSWWTGMNTPLQLMIYGENLKGATVRSLDKGLEITAVHEAESPNYLFVDVRVSSDAKAGEYRLEIEKNGKRLIRPYQIMNRRPGSAQRGSFSSADMVYLLMPDRFADGDPATNNTPNTIEKVDRNNPNGRHGGDIQGIIDHLDYIQGLGATAIWPTPVTLDNEPSYSYHGYACADYYMVDPRLGTNDLYKKMVEEAHRRDMKVILDAVPNHCGTYHWWMKDLPFKDWINQFPKYTQTNGLFYTNSDPHASQIDLKECVDGWFVETMPDLNMGNPFVEQYLKQVAIWWVEWADLDGIRVDTYPYNEKNKIAEWTKAIREEYPNLNLVGECWVGSPAMVSYWEGDNDNRDGYNSHLPSVMDFPLQEATIEGIKKDSAGWGEGFKKIYYTLAHDFVYNRPNTLFIFGDNHDIDRLAYLLGENPKKVKLAITLMATMRGVPQIYYGTELMFVGDPKEGHGGERMDFPGGWPGDKINLFKPEQRSKEQADIYDHTSKLFNWRKTAETIHNGKMMHYNPTDNVYVYFRYTDKGSVMTILNGSRKKQTIDWSRYNQMTSGYKSGKDVVSGKGVVVGDDLVVPPLTSMVIELAK